jgi:purine-binding chemotaxis protein CheW
METINNFKLFKSRTAIAGQNQNFLSLDEMIADIDNEIAHPLINALDKEEITSDLVDAPIDLKHQYILLALGKIQFALPLSCTLEIGRHPAITPLPNLPNWVLGICNIRGEIISFINLKAFFGISPTGAKSSHRFLIIHNQNLKVGIIVDRIMGILSLNQIDSHLQNSPFREGEIANYIIGVVISGEYLTNILDIDKLLSCERMTDFKQLE